MQVEDIIQVFDAVVELELATSSYMEKQKLVQEETDADTINIPYEPLDEWLPWLHTIRDCIDEHMHPPVALTTGHRTMTHKASAKTWSWALQNPRGDSVINRYSETHASSTTDMGVEMGIPTLEVAGGAESLLPPWVDKKPEMGPDIDEPDSEEPDGHDEPAAATNGSDPLAVDVGDDLEPNDAVHDVDDSICGSISIDSSDHDDVDGDLASLLADGDDVDGGLLRDGDDHESGDADDVDGDLAGLLPDGDDVDGGGLLRDGDVHESGQCDGDRTHREENTDCRREHMWMDFGPEAPKPNTFMPAALRIAGVQHIADNSNSDVHQLLAHWDTYFAQLKNLKDY